MDEGRIKKPLYKKWWVYAIILFVILGVIFSGENEEIAGENDNNLVLPDFEIVEEDDVSLGDVIRKSYWIYPEGGTLTEEQFEQTSINIVENLKKEFDFNAISLFFIDDPDNPVGYQIGMTEYVPNGEWSDAIEYSAGDYKDHEYVFKFNE
ncbi:hypothetical protein [Evansella tamaricis]|uniref:Uncharacterized protein n=1 Tax=Evansella tamaricis TaxID=2069301 RepID=A0ABS6JBR6_9BACI|nr:hypothetical protein [Evansella tamaricis]MBU9711118.1 hypothetical protein [Evansella tamaricis]